MAEYTYTTCLQPVEEVMVAIKDSQIKHTLQLHHHTVGLHQLLDPATMSMGQQTMHMRVIWPHHPVPTHAISILPEMGPSVKA